MACEGAFRRVVCVTRGSLRSCLAGWIEWNGVACIALPTSILGLLRVSLGVW